MNTWRIGPETSLAQLAATIVLADTGVGNARVRLYTTDRPDDLGGATDTPQSEIVLAKPCATLVGGVMVLHPLNGDGAMVLLTGLPRWGELVSAAGVIVTDGSVTDLDGDGDFRVAGGETPEGETSPLLYAGGLVLLGETSLS